MTAAQTGRKGSNKSVHLRTGTWRVLIEALRRRQRFNDLDRDITGQWTGLGSATQYRQAVEDGLMVCATSPNPGHITWWSLTPRGALVVTYWIGLGFTYERIEAGELPPSEIPYDVLGDRCRCQSPDAKRGARGDAKMAESDVVREARQLARRVFAKRGNHSEAHISEQELMVMFGVAIEKGRVLERNYQTWLSDQCGTAEDTR